MHSSLFASALSVLSLVAMGSCEQTAPAHGEDAFLSDYNVDSYEIKAELDWQSRSMLATLNVRLHLIDDDTTQLILSSQVQVEQVTAQSGQNLPFTQDGESLVIDLTSLDTKTRDELFGIAITYRAGASEALRIVDGHTLTAATSRVFFTNSEPEDTSLWMPCHNLPADRATFRVSLTLAPEETMVSNGGRISDVVAEAGKHVVTYQISQPIPTYLMAFAAGELTVTTQSGPGFELEVWRRRDVNFDAQAVLDDLAKQATRLQELLGRYPFPRYSLVFLPDFNGGMENAGVTFQSETSGTAPALLGQRNLNAHEFAHQWFGDNVTLRTWDDLWIKEGLATHLAAELLRDAWETQGQVDLLGLRFSAAEGAAILDPEKAPEDKYDSGPYGRSAWLFSQIRAAVGDQRFFNTLQSIQNQFALSSIDTDSFVDQFADSLSKSQLAAVRSALVAKALPKVTVETQDESATLTLTDSESALVVDLEVSWVDQSGVLATIAIAANQSTTIARPHPDALLVIDPRNVHPYGRFFGEELAKLDAFRRPTNAATREVFLTQPGSHHESAGTLAVANLTPQELALYVERLQTTNVKLRVIDTACTQAITAEQDIDAWRTALKPLVQTIPPGSWLDGRARMTGCSQLFSADELFAEQLNHLADARAPFDFVALSYLAKFDYAAQVETGIWLGLAQNSGDVAVRKLALRHLTQRVLTLEEPAKSEMHTYFRQVVRESDNHELSIRAASVLPSLSTPGEAEALADLEALRTALADHDRTLTHASALCTAYALLDSDGAALSSWVEGIDTTVWLDAAHQTLQDPTRCD